MYRQFNAAAFQGPLTGSDGLESRERLPARLFPEPARLRPSRATSGWAARGNLQLRVDMFNAPNAAGITARNTTMNLASPADPVTITNLPYDAERQPDRRALASARRGFRRSHGVSESAQRAGDGAVLVLTTVSPRSLSPGSPCRTMTAMRTTVPSRPRHRRQRSHPVFDLRLWADLRSRREDVMSSRRSRSSRCVLTSACSREQTPAQATVAANVLIVTIDTLRADRLGIYGATNVETPNIDRLAREGAWARAGDGARAADAAVARLDLHRAAIRPSTASATTSRRRSAPDVPVLAEHLPAARDLRPRAFVVVGRARRGSRGWRAASSTTPTSSRSARTMRGS